MVSDGSILDRSAAEPGPASRGHFNQSGQVMGAKGLMKRRRLVAATAALIKDRPLRDVQAIDIASAAGTSSSSFYLYFDNVLDAVLAVAGEICQSTPTVLQFVEDVWDIPSGYENALALVAEHLDFWDRHRALLRIRNLAAEDGDERFILVRRLSLQPLLDALGRQVLSQQELGRVDPSLDAVTVAGALLAMLDRIGAAMHSVRDRSPRNERAVLRSTAYIIATALGCG